MKHMKNERGQALIIIALAAIGLFGIVGLAIDGSAKFSDRRHAQNAADAAALAAALAKANALTNGLSNSPAECPPTSGLPSDVCAAVITAALDLADENGYDNSASKQVDVYSPPISGFYEDDPTYVQVIIDSDVNTTFSRVVGINQTHNVVEAVSLTKEGGPLFNGASIVSLNPNPGCGSGSVKVTGSGDITLSGGGIFVNSSASCGFREPSCTDFEIINGGGISSAGSPIDLNGCHVGLITTDEDLSQFAVPDEVYMPKEPAVCTTQSPINQYTKSGDNVTLYPGYFTAFPPITKNSYVITMQPGTYCIDTSIHWTNGSFESLTGSDVTLYITSGHEFDMSGGRLNLSAPTSDTNDYAGYVIILDGEQGSIEDCSINGGGGGTITGTVFTPYCDIKVNGSSGTDSLSAQVIGWNVTLNGNNSLNFTYNPGDNAENKRKIGLMK